MERKDEKKREIKTMEEKFRIRREKSCEKAREIRLIEKIALGFSKTSQIFTFLKKEIT